MRWRLFCLLLACLAAGHASSNCLARTISLVYDDSGSMLRENGLRWQNANYATQVLAGLLKEDDVLFLVRMNGDPGGSVTPLRAEQRRRGLKAMRDWPPPIENIGTPYAAVRVAANVFEKQANAAPQLLGARDADWLIIITDGAFEEGQQQGERQGEGIAEHAAQFFADSQGRQTRVAFLLISKDAEERYALLWRQKAPVPEQVSVLKTSAQHLTQAMEQVARLINGRDEQSLQVERTGRSLRFKSEFPLARISILEQADGADLAKIKQIESPPGAAAQAAVFDLATPQRNKPLGLIHHLSSGKVMAAGLYGLHFDRDLSNRRMQVLIEPAIDFTIQALRALDKRPLPETSPGLFSACAEEEIIYSLHFFDTSKGAAATFAINDSLAKRLELNAQRDGKRLALARHAGSGAYLSAPMPAGMGLSRLSAEAKYPGYFHLKSNLVSIEGKDCRRKALFTAEQSVISISPQEAASFEPAAQFALRREGDEYSGAHTLQAPDLPKGMQIAVQGQVLKQQGDTVSVNVKRGQSLRFDMFTNEEFRPSKPLPLTLRLRAENPQVRDIAPISLMLHLKPRALSLTPAAGRWRARADEVASTPGPRVDLLVDGRKISSEQQRHYRLEASAKGRFGAAIVADGGQGGYRLALTPSWPQCLSPSGEIMVELSALGPFPGEQARLSLPLYIDPLPWWRQYGPCLFKLLLLGLLLGWIIACMKKRRFARDAALIHQRSNPALEVKPREEKFYLCAWRAEGNKGYNVLVAWCWPFGPEQRTVEGLNFQAGLNRNHIFLPASQQHEQMRLDHLPLTHPGQRDLSLGSANVLAVSSGQYVETYRYQRQ